VPPSPSLAEASRLTRGVVTIDLDPPMGWFGLVTRAGLAAGVGRYEKDTIGREKVVMGVFRA
jgi:hypothetical protein